MEITRLNGNYFQVDDDYVRWWHPGMQPPAGIMECSCGLGNCRHMQALLALAKDNMLSPAPESSVPCDDAEAQAKRDDAMRRIIARQAKQIADEATMKRPG